MHQKSGLSELGKKRGYIFKYVLPQKPKKYRKREQNRNRQFIIFVSTPPNFEYSTVPWNYNVCYCPPAPFILTSFWYGRRFRVVAPARNGLEKVAICMLILHFHHIIERTRNGLKSFLMLHFYLILHFGSKYPYVFWKIPIK